MARRSLGTQDRVVLDVGGTKFITSSSTLTSNSSYFASLLSDNWTEQSDTPGDNEIFIDQDPVPFKVLLAYMRRGGIKIDDIDTDVLLLAEFLGIERLLLAIKVRWFCNIGKGPVHSTDDEIAVTFDQEHGGIMKAISSGLFRYFLKQNNVDAEKEFATLRISKVAGRTPGAPFRLRCTLKEVGKLGPEHLTSGLHCALNGLHLKGYTHHESQLKTKDTYTYSRRKHDVATMSRGGVTDIFIPNDNETSAQERNVKQFACVLKDKHDTIQAIGAPSEFHQDESIRSNPLLNSNINEPGPWLEDNGFVTREDAYEDIFREYIESSLSDNTTACMFSRVISKSRNDASW